jgi:hypothetical protein
MPDVVPAPVGKLFVCVIEETAEPPADVDMPGIRSSKPIREYVAVQGWDLRIVDKDVKDAAGNPPAELASYLDRAKGQALPWVVAADSKGTLAIDQRCPANAAALLDLLKKYGGVK